MVPVDFHRMGFLDFQSYSLWILIAAFLTASVFVWYAGTKLLAYLDTIANETGLGHAFIGMLLLGGITSLPEVATVSTASLTGNAPLAINNVLGSASINVVLLAFADAMLGRRALTSVIGQPNPLLQGTLDILLLTVVVTAIATGDVLIFGVGAWATLLVPLYVFALWLSSQYEHRQTWAADGSRQRQDQRKEGEKAEREQQGDARQEDGSLRSAIVKTCIAALVILVAGYVLARSGDAIAAKTGIGSSFIGLVLVGFATSLPEVSAIYAAVKLERYSMILGDIFGTNLFNVVLIFIADLFYSGPPVLSVVGTFEAVATLLAVMLTGIYLVGLLERRDRTIWRMGYPSFAVILTFSGGLVLLYFVSTGDYGG